MAKPKKSPWEMTDTELVRHNKALMRTAVRAMVAMGDLPGRDCIYAATYSPLIDLGMGNVQKFMLDYLGEAK